MNDTSEKYLKTLNKNNITVKYRDGFYYVRSSYFRFVFLRDFSLLGLFIYLLLSSKDSVYWFALISLIVAFSYFLWEDLKSMNNLKIDPFNHTISISHTNIIRYLILKKLDGYKSIYSFKEIDSFSVIDKWRFRSVETKYYISMNLKAEKSFILLDVPYEPNAIELSAFLNQIIKSG